MICCGLASAALALTITTVVIAVADGDLFMIFLVPAFLVAAVMGVLVAVSLEVSDDGAGLPDGWRAGVGITAMRERAAELGGELTIEPARPRGTRITARLPVDRPQ
jgi:hypothetical protein